MAQIFRGPATLNFSAATTDAPAALIVVSASTDALLRESNRINDAILVQLKIQNEHLTLVTGDAIKEDDLDASSN